MNRSNSDLPKLFRSIVQQRKKELGPEAARLFSKKARRVLRELSMSPRHGVRCNAAITDLLNDVLRVASSKDEAAD